NGWIADLPALGAGDRIEFWIVEKPLRFVVSPPTGKSGQREIPSVPLVHEAAADGAGAGIEILIAAPYGEVGIPIVQLQGCIADRMSQVDTHVGADPARRRDQRRHAQ